MKTAKEWVEIGEADTELVSPTNDDGVRISERYVVDIQVDARCEMEAERDCAVARCRSAAQVLIASVGASGPMNVHDAARRAEGRIAELTAERDGAVARITELLLLVEAAKTRGVWMESQRDAAMSLLYEWLSVPYFKEREDWQRWVSDFRPRVQAALVPWLRRPYPTAPQSKEAPNGEA
jgi:hypothetical protein